MSVDLFEEEHNENSAIIRRITNDDWINFENLFNISRNDVFEIVGNFSTNSLCFAHKSDEHKYMNTGKNWYTECDDYTNNSMYVYNLSYSPITHSRVWTRRVFG